MIDEVEEYSSKSSTNPDNQGLAKVEEDIDSFY